jgi:hypothetical protein
MCISERSIDPENIRWNRLADCAYRGRRSRCEIPNGLRSRQIGLIRGSWQREVGQPPVIRKWRIADDGAFMRTQLVFCRLPKADSTLLRSSLFQHLCRFVSFVRWISVGEGVPLPRPRIQVVHGTVPQKYACNTLPARSGILRRPALGKLCCRPPPTSSTRAPEVTPN